MSKWLVLFDFKICNNKLFRVYIADDGSTQVAIDEKMKSEENLEQVISIVMKSLTESFEKNYLKAMKILLDSDDKILNNSDS